LHHHSPSIARSLSKESFDGHAILARKEKADHQEGSGRHADPQRVHRRLRAWHRSAGAAGPDLGRDRYHQGHGMPNLMQMLLAV
jgi:hypothetical protein